MSEQTTFLEAEEVSRLTGYVRHAEQRRQLRHMGIQFVVSRMGEPLVLRKAFEAQMGIGHAPDEAMASLEHFERMQAHG